MGILTGLDQLYRDNFSALKGKRIGLVCNQATVTSQFRHVLDLLTPLHREGLFSLEAVFGPQHGLFGHTQDNMIEWEGGSSQNRWGIPIHSLYGERRSPSHELIRGLDMLVIDLPDIGSRYYTFLWTTALCIQACEKCGVPVMILDRPNPVGNRVEGPVLESSHASFVGLYPLPIRHGMTLGQAGRYLGSQYFPGAEVSVLEVEGSGSGPWVMPSPNMPTLDTALVYPGGCLLEGTNVSEGRGTTRPFETFGAPFVDGWKLAGALNRLGLPGTYFRPLQFQPTFQKHVGKICEGCFLHVTDSDTFEPVLSYVALLQELRRQCGDAFSWNDPPYEYEAIKLPIDILAGNGWLRPAIDGLEPLFKIRDRMEASVRGLPEYAMGRYASV